jgi:uncharacterized surface protein with fasciclin (FAS1) repeats
MRVSLKRGLASLAALGLVFAVAPAPANATTGTNSLAAVLDVANPAFDRNNADFDILTAAVLAVLEAKPNSPVSVLADGSVALTAFIPTDGAFRKLVRQLGVRNWRTMSEADVFGAVAGLGIDAVEKVLLHHVVVGPAINLNAAVRANGAVLTTAAGQNLTVRVDSSLRLQSDAPFWDPTVSLARTDINAGNLQLAHVINNVIVPDLG